MSKLRPRLPRQLVDGILYKSAKTCCVCRVREAPVEVHHVDEDPSNNTESNLVAICRNCHDEAHTSHSLSQNLTPSRLSFFKSEWEKEVAKTSSLAMLPRSNLDQAMWTFINHQRIQDVFRRFEIDFDRKQLAILIRAGVVDRFGLPTFKLPKIEDGSSTIYDRFDWDESRRLHYLYTEAVDRLIIKMHPVEIGAIWTKREIRSMIKPGTICYCIRGYHFKRAPLVRGAEDRQVYARSKNIEIRFLANTRHMYGSSALWTNFAGSRFAAVLLLVKDMESSKNTLVIHGTPLAMGAGFVPDEYKSPYELHYGWSNWKRVSDPVRECF